MATAQQSIIFLCLGFSRAMKYNLKNIQTILAIQYLCPFLFGKLFQKSKLVVQKRSIAENVRKSVSNAHSKHQKPPYF